MCNPLNRFIRKTAIFAAIILSLALIAELILRSDTTSPYSVKQNYIEKDGNRIATLILGSSHTYYGLVPSEMGDSVFNLANISQSPEYDLDLLRKNLPQMPYLRHVIIPVSYFTFTDPELENSPEWRLCINYKIWMDAGGHSDFSKYNFTISDFPSFCQRIRSWLGAGGRVNRCDSLGFGLGYTLESRNPSWKSTGAARAASLTGGSAERRDEVIACLDSIMTLCENSGVDVTLVTTPVWHTFSENVDSLQLEAMYRAAKSLSERHRCRYIDYFSSPLFVSDDFYDTDHLSSAGAVKLSRLLVREL